MDGQLKGPSVHLSDCAPFPKTKNKKQKILISLVTFGPQISLVPGVAGKRPSCCVPLPWERRLFAPVVAFSHHWHPGSPNPSCHSPEVRRLCSGVRNAALCSSHGQSCASTLCSWCPSRYWSRSRLRGHPRALGRRLQCHRLHTYDCSRLASRRCGPWKRPLPWQRHSPCWVVRTLDNLVPQRTSWNTTHSSENRFEQDKDVNMKMLKTIISNLTLYKNSYITYVRLFGHP